MTSKKPAGEVPPMSTVLSYALGYGSGNQFINAVIGTYISVFLTDTFGVPAGAVGFIMVAATIWDAVYSLIVGGLAFVRFIVPVITAVIVILCLRVYPVNESVKEQMKDLYRNKEVSP